MQRNFILILFLLISWQVRATHQRSGEITYRCKGGLSYEFTILTYTFSPSPADRPKLEVLWGDGSKNDVIRAYYVDTLTDIRKNVYIGVHTYNGPGTYKISVEDPNRNNGILNIPNSVNIPFFIESMLVISPFFACNNSPELLLPPIDQGCTNTPFIHNPGAYDPDGDSLSYKLTTCRGAGGLPIPGYVLPNQVGSNTSGTITLDVITGDFVWDSPKMVGEYNIAILIEEWRNGIRIGYVTRDMQIIIDACNNHPPYFDPVPDTCVVAGGVVDFTVTAHDPDANTLTLTGTGGPIVIPDNPATFLQPVVGQGTVSSDFHWETVCKHVRRLPYQLYFKVKDNSYPVNLIDLMTVNVTVIGPPVPGLTVVPFGNTFRISWNKSPCTNATGYRLFRRNGFYGYVPGYCETGVPAYTGYRQISEFTSLNDTTFTDDDNGAGLIHGIDYCYIVIAYYGDGALSIASEEVCATLKRDLPIITNVSIRTTDVSNGYSFVGWVKPTELDPLQTPGPFKYFIFRSVPFGNNWSLIDSLDGLNDTTYVDSLINTKDQPVGYRIGLLNNTPGNRFEAGATQNASSVFLTLFPTDEKVVLTWNYTVPWLNDSATVFRYNPSTLLFDSIGRSFSNTYIDSGLVNGQQYCYKLLSYGHYSAASLPRPLLNYSQETCGIPVDNVAPCPPALKVFVNCELNQNTLLWSDPNHICTGDVAGYKVYYSPLEGGDYTVIASPSSAEDTLFYHTGLTGIAGCYAVTALDTSGNESAFSNVICIDIDSCPQYHLPNVFTPNHDGVNDYFRPFPYSSVEKIEIQIFDRWGRVVFKTADPDINWDGMEMNSHQLCSDGPYFYICEVYEITLKGLRKRRLSGVVHLLSGN
ncbi:MAG: gliding motility-associated C-terminal domain-containing protein [Bacteroidetes bacterium]|nr:gliding motility-associated C-terminal domain-containing protein [Bacteroidota bacterium]